MRSQQEAARRLALLMITASLTSTGAAWAQSCTDLCEPDGLRECVTTYAWYICADHDGDGCLEWSEWNLCPGGEVCEDGFCVECIPNCAGRECGDDGCGSTCPPGCVSGLELCVARVCVDRGDNCDDCLFDEQCLPGYSCFYWTSYPDAYWCAAPCSDDTDCPEHMNCNASSGFCFGDWLRECIGDAVWRVDGCGNQLEELEVCGVGETCVDGDCLSPCVPDCVGRECGPDGCDGTCGPGCDLTGRCNDVAGTCIALGDNCDDCDGSSDCLPDYSCRFWTSYPTVGWCAASCDDDTDCPEHMHCATSGACAGDWLRECIGNSVWRVDGCGNHLEELEVCGVDEPCSDGYCECVPDCAVRECGPDGCGGTCGPGCDPTERCDDDVGICIALGDSCDDCDDSNDCLPGYSCRSWTSYPAVEWCAAPCGDDIDCPEHMSCAPSGFCAGDWLSECIGDAVWRVDGCGNHLEELEVCAADEHCVVDECLPPCIDECAPSGVRECVSGTSYRNCSDHDVDGCLEWSAPIECSIGEICTGGDCVDGCVPFCDGRECGDDGCGGDCGFCDTGETCDPLEGVCLPPCTDECAPLGGRVCASGNSYRICEDHDVDGCLEWSAPIDCSVGEICTGIGDCTVGECDPSQWACDDGGCIEMSALCDGFAHCDDGSDEVGCGECTEEQFRCDDGGCVVASDYCNGVSDCADSSDERGCGGCAPDEIECSDGSCAASAAECGCVPDCSATACGPDPVCGQECGPCGGELHCDEGRCVDCLTVDNCGGGERCDASGDCIDDCSHPEANACPPGQVCDEANECVDEPTTCDDDSDCDELTGHCDIERGECVACLTDDHCSPDLVCNEEGLCALPTHGGGASGCGCQASTRGTADASALTLLCLFAFATLRCGRRL